MMLDNIVVREDQEYKDIVDNTIKCMSCEKSLFVIFKSADGDIEQEYQANCPYCDGQSYKFIENGYFSLSPELGLDLESIDSEEGNQITINKILLNKSYD